MRELALKRNDFVVAKECTGAKTRAVHDDRFVQGHHVPGSIEFADDDVSPKQQEIACQRIEINRRLKTHGGLLDRVFRGKRMLSWSEHGPTAAHVLRQKLALTALRAYLIHQVITGNPGHAVIRTSEKLKLPVCNLDSSPELGIPFRSAAIVFDQAGSWSEPGKRHVGCRIRGNGHRVDRDVETTALQLSRGCQANHAASDDCGAALFQLERHLGCDVSRAPRKRHPGSAVAIVVDEHLRIEFVRPQYETGVAMWTQTHRRSDYAVPRSLDQGKIYRASRRCGAGWGIDSCSPGGRTCS